MQAAENSNAEEIDKIGPCSLFTTLIFLSRIFIETIPITAKAGSRVWSLQNLSHNNNDL